MQLGYEKKLYILAFDHRGSFQKKFFGIEGEPDPEQTAMIADAKHLIFEGMQRAVAEGADASVTGVLVDEQFGGSVPEEAQRAGPQARDAGRALRPEHVRLPVRRATSASTSKASTPTSPRCWCATTPTATSRKTRATGQAEAPLRLASLQAAQVPVRAARAGRGPPSYSRSKASTERYDAELRPELMRRAIAEIQDAGIEVDIWKIEGVDERSDCEMLVAQARTGGRDGVVCVVFGRGADDAKVDHWLEQAAPVDGFVGFAIGRSIWWNPLKEYVDGKIERSSRSPADRRELLALRQGLRARRGQDPGGIEGRRR